MTKDVLAKLPTEAAFSGLDVLGKIGGEGVLRTEKQMVFTLFI